MVLDNEQLGGLAEAAGVEGVNTIITAFWEATAQLTADLAAAVDACDYNAVLQLSHAIKGSAANVGASRLAERARLVEDAARAEASDVMRAEVQSMPEDISATKLAIEDLLATYA